ncbi:MAG: porin [Hyphomicrobiaceae bacterium]
MNTAKKFAIAAAVTALMGTTAYAADLGGSCCADLEERIAELEATTVRKGNRKVSLQISGFVGAQVMWWDDGSQSDTYFNEDSNNTSRFRFKGTANIAPDVSAGFTYEFAVTGASSSSVNQLNGGDDLGTSGNCPGGSTAGCAGLRDATVWLKHARLGMVKLGQGSTSTDNLILIDLGQKGVASTPDIALHNGGFLLRGNNGLIANTGVTWAGAIRGNESFDTDRRNHVLYETPTLAGFSVQAAVAEDNFWDVALRYAGEHHGFRVAFGIGYQENTEFNAPTQFGVLTTGDLCTTTCDAKSSDLKGSLSVLHVPTGLFFTGAAGSREVDGSLGPVNTEYLGPDLKWYFLSGGISKNFFGIGNTVLYGEYLESEGGLEQNAFLTNNANYNNNTVISSNSEVNMWGLGITQNLDNAAMEIYASYKNYSLDATGFLGGNASLNKGVSGVSDFSVFMLGTKINF